MERLLGLTLVVALLSVAGWTPETARAGRFLVDGPIGRSAYSFDACPDEFNEDKHDKNDWATSIRVGYM